MRTKTNKIVLMLLMLMISIYSIFDANISYGVNPLNDKKTIKLAGDYNHPPYEYADEYGNFKGFNVDIMNAIAEAMDMSIEIIPMEWGDATKSLENGEIDGLIGISKNNERLKKFLFTTPTIINEQFIFVNKDTVHINDLEDLSGLNVAYQKSDYNEELLKQVDSIVGVPMIGQEESLIALRGGKVDAAIGNKLVGIYHLQKNKMVEQIKLIGEPLGIVEYGPAVLKGNTELLEILEKGLEQIRENDTYDNVYKKWFGEDVDYSRVVFNIYKKEILVVVFIIGLIILFLYFQSRKLKYEVLRRTSELESANNDLIGQQKEIYNLAYYDTITSLPNRLYFVEELNNLSQNGEGKDSIFGILFLDIDKFKHINDTLGHNVGDYILKLLGMRLNKLIEEGDIVARVGGDEYFILMNNIKSSEDAIKMAEIIIKDFKEPYHIQGHRLYLTTSIGIAMYPDGGNNSQTLIKNSDLALYKAKELGGNSYYLYGEEIESTGLQRMILLNQLRQSIERDELVLYYQPQIDILSGKIRGVEALVRWNHPEKGLIYPDTFIPLAEESGLIIQIGSWVLEKAFMQAKEWIDNGHDIVMSVNISVKQFQCKGFIKGIEDMLNESGLNPKNLTLEITETTAISNMDHTLTILEKLKALNIAVAIDDFGTGYSSLNYLNQMSVNELKIDRSFIWDIENNDKNKMISNTIIILAKQLGLKVTAEGVENLEQLTILQEMECDMAQGYHFSRPVPKDEIDNMIK